MRGLGEDETKGVNEGIIFNIISVYSPLRGCEEAEKDRFTEKLEDLVRKTPEEEDLITRADLNGKACRVMDDGDMGQETQKVIESLSRQRTYSCSLPTKENGTHDHL